MSSGPDSDPAASAAMLTAATMIAHQVGGKATRDALFLSSFDVTSLPYMLIGSSLFSFAMVFLFSRVLTRLGPARAIPIAFGVSALFLFGEWTLFYPHPDLASVLVYLHMAGLGSVLISGFWSVVNERFDPRTAKRQIGRIAGGATFGGLLGGVLAERVANSLSVAAMLPILGLLHLFCAWRVRGLNLPAISPAAHTEKVSERGEAEPELGSSSWQILRGAPYLRNLAILVLLAAISNVSLDYVFKAQAAQAYGRGENLLRFFAIFYTAVALGTFIIQTTLSRRALEKLGLARTVGSLPLVVAAGGLGAAAVPGLASAAIAKGLGSVTNDSLFRSGYEILYTPIPPKEKRATKSLVDVGCDRLGDLLGGGIIRLILQFAPAFAIPSVLGVAVALAMVGLWFTRQVNRGYVVSLERGLLNRAVELDLSEVRDSTTRSTLLQTLHSKPDASLAASLAAGSRTGLQIHKASGQLSSIDPLARSALAEPPRADPTLADPVVRKVAALRSGDARKIRQVLHEQSSWDLTLVPHAIALLAWDDVAPDVVTTLRNIGPQITGQLVDALLDPDQPDAVRRRIPRVLAASASERAADGLLAGLRDARFEVRFQCGNGLAAIAKQNPAIGADPARVFRAVEREAAVGKKVWESRRLLDRTEDPTRSPFLDDLLRDRASRSLEHVFRLLSLVLPKEPLQIAFRGLHTSDQNLRGIALEYLESVLPATVREGLWPYLEDQRTEKREARSPEEIMATLLRSHASIELNLAELRERLDARKEPTGAS